MTWITTYQQVPAHISKQSVKLTDNTRHFCSKLIPIALIKSNMWPNNILSGEKSTYEMLQRIYLKKEQIRLYVSPTEYFSQIQATHWRLLFHTNGRRTATILTLLKWRFSDFRPIFLRKRSFAQDLSKLFQNRRYYLTRRFWFNNYEYHVVNCPQLP